MKKVILSLTLTSLLVAPIVGFAALQEPPKNVSIWTILTNIVKWLFSALILVAVIFIIVAGYLFVTAQGDPDRVKKARDMVLYAIIGVIVAIAAYAFVNIASNIAGGGGFF